MSRRSHRWVARRVVYRRPYGTAIAVFLTSLVLVRWWQHQHQLAPPDALSEGTYLVRRVVDGDTLLLANQARVRLIGADTPECVKPNSPVEPFGPEATDFANQFVAQAEGAVRLQFDRERIDRYGRFLAYVWADDRMLNEELIRAGLATAETGFGYSSAMKRRFRRAEDEAKAGRRGIWSPGVAPAGNL
jgi:micrococcal nuclease